MEINNLEKIESTLLNNGFTETTSKIDKQKGKKTFTHLNKKRGVINFNYTQVDVICKLGGIYLYTKISKSDLLNILLYFNLQNKFLKEIFPNKNYEIINLDKRINHIKKLISNEKTNLKDKNKYNSILKYIESLKVF
ncbi:hypothetical protein [Algoriphagus hitonicola]|uniref:Uncharacterized protein n=1 Tax=Algoriphagus hitonicola TaxID=435880 RepID=A0A1I2PDU1_9BACT|nr:hypothetical protein [Algoriphagus hitonicola]SFG14244.1 hypothetical protein SAMN04487988_101554 [Algoriphagus hitonicola]